MPSASQASRSDAGGNCEATTPGERTEVNGVTILVVAHDLNPLLTVLDGAIYLLDGHAHFDTMDEVVNEDLLSHLYGTSIQVVHTPQGDLYMRSV